MEEPGAVNARGRGTRERVIAAAIEVFADSGYEGATVRGVCRRAGVNVAAVNYHFGSKRALYRAVFDHVFRRLRRARTPHLPVSAPPRERLRAFVAAAFDELVYREGERRTQVAALVLREMARPTEVLNWVVEAHLHADHAELKDILERLLGRGATPDRVRDAAASVMGQVLYHYYARAVSERLNPGTPPLEERRDELVEHVTRFSLEGIQGLRAPRPPAARGS